jgi:hypothetical protein
MDGTGYQHPFERRLRHIANQHMAKALDSAVYAVNLFIVSAGTWIFGIVAPTKMWSGTAPVWLHGDSGMHRVVKRSCCAVSRRVAAAKLAEDSGGMPKLITGSRYFAFGPNTAIFRGQSCLGFGACQTFR